ncbi:hypothetical protein J4Q44_G00174260 [Coregonus suidteri]|uniref:Uncharacterized protein n=1 Tax=Coregonus suidteri TaxID=861788 RepID=A0AAN8LG69_9TELE
MGGSVALRHIQALELCSSARNILKSTLEQMCSFADCLSKWLVAVLMLLVIHLPVQAGKCPRFCICYISKLTMACIGKNLIQVPPTIDEAFLPVSKSLKQLYTDDMGLEKMSRDSLAGLGSGLTTLSLGGNQLEELPDLSPLTGLEVINLAHNPLLCDCPLLPLRKSVVHCFVNDQFVDAAVQGSHAHACM